MLPTWFCRLQEFWQKWAIRVTAPFSLGMHILVLILADTRRYNARPWWTLALWLAYQLLDYSGSYSLGHLSLDDTGDDAATTAKEQLLVSFWGPFLLLHLSGPDNVGAYSLDDNKLGWRKVVGAISKIVVALHSFVTKIWFDDNAGLLRPAAGIMLAVGVLRVLGNMWAMLQALRKKKKKDDEGDEDDETTTTTAAAAKKLVFGPAGEKKGVWQAIVSAGWEKLSEEATETASKLFDVLYTKSGQIHTGVGYLIRLLSPVASTAALALFVLYPKDCVLAVDVIITYVLLSFAVVLDVAWLAAALASQSAYRYAEAYWPCFLFRHQILRCGGWWHELRSMALLLHPWRLVGVDPCGYRMWLGSSVGRYDLVRECTRGPDWNARLRGWLWGIIGQGAGWDDFRAWACSSELPELVKRVLFQRIMDRLDDEATPMEDIRKHWGQVAALRRRKNKKFQGGNLLFGRQFHEDILLWHIGTTIYLALLQQQQPADDAETTTTRERVRAIEVVSEYLMFLAAARPHMVPDTPLPRLYEATHQALRRLYSNEKKKKKAADPCCFEFASRKKQELAEIILGSKQKMKKPVADSDSGEEDGAAGRLISDAAELAIRLRNVDAPVQDVVELVFDVWVDKLQYAAIGCSRESHARQLGRGGELVTIVWIAAEYAGVFTTDKTPPPVNPDDTSSSDDSDSDDCPIKPPKCPDQKPGCCCPKEKEETTCHCHQGLPLEPVCPQPDYCYTQAYYDYYC